MAILKNIIRRLAANGKVGRQLAEAQRLLHGRTADLQRKDAVAQAIGQYLQSPAWEVRNAAVKLVPKLGEPALFDHVVAALANRRESGIVRRNAATAIRDAHHWSPAAQRAVADSLWDGYWEVRTEAVKTLAAMASPGEQTEALVLAALFRRPPQQCEAEPAAAYRRWPLRERNFEVRAACAQALGSVACSERGIAALRRLSADRTWIVCYQAAIALAEVAFRDERFRTLAIDQLRQVRITPECAVPDDPLRQQLAQLRMAVRRGAHKGRPEQVRSMYLDLKKGWNVASRASPALKVPCEGPLEG